MDHHLPLSRLKFIGCSVLFPVLCFVLAFHEISSECRMPDPYFPNGEILYEKDDDANKTVASEYYLLRFQCNKDYERSGPQIIICFGGKWNYDIPQCTSMSCNYPPHVSNAIYETEKGLAVGSVARYDCESGLEFENQTAVALTCTLNNGSAHWEGDIPKCVEKATCPDPEVSLQGYKQGDCCFIDDVVHYSCRSGYQLVGPDNITCLKGGVWSSERPKCRPMSGHCPNPPFIENGTVESVYKTSDFYIAFEEVEVVCNPGYAYFGISEFVMCTEDFDWDEDFGECLEIFCPRPEPPLNGKILELEGNNQTDFPHKFEISYVCDKGFRLYGAVYRSCDAGNWTEDEPVCEAIKCPNPKTIDNGNAVITGLHVGQKAVFYCNPGYNLLGSEERYCLLNGQWSGELTRCNLKRNFCPDPGIPINGRKVGHSYNEGDIVEFRCFPGFSLIGSKTRQCQSNKEWSGEEARCLGAYDFDNTADVGEKMKLLVNKKAEDQAVELEKTDALLATMNTVRINGTLVRRTQIKRILNLSYTGRLVFYFVFDVSGSVRKPNFDTSIKFAKALVQKVGITENGARAGAYIFSSKAKEVFTPVLFKNTEDVLNELDKIEYESGGTATSSALYLLRRESIPLVRERLGFTGVKHIIFILTDGKANTGGDPEEEAEKLKKSKDVEIYCIGITGDTLKNSLYRIASKPTDEHVFILNNYKTLEWLIQEITNGTIDYSKCGLGLENIGKSHDRSRIVQGKKVYEPWPWMAALYITDRGPNELELKCGGSLIGSRWVMTAAHCLCNEDEKAPRPVHQVVVRLGLTDVKNFTHLQEFESEQFFIHPAYNPFIYDNDIGLIKLHGVVNYNAYVRPICLPPLEIPKNSTLYKTNESAYAAGWGHPDTMEGGEKVKGKTLRDLKELFLPLQSRQRCMESLENKNEKRIIFTNQMLCAGTGTGSGDTCIGDSGGPLMQSQINQDSIVYWTQVGIVSWGIGCNQVDTYGFYSHVKRLLPWIDNVTMSDE